MSKNKWKNRSSLRKGLVLTLKEGETVSIADGEIIVELVEIRGQNTRIAFVADPQIRIIREKKETEK